MLFVVATDNGTFKETIASIGGGTIVAKDNLKDLEAKEVYPHQKMSEIYDICKKNDWSLYDYVAHYESEDIQSYFENVLRVMDEAVERGLKAEGYLPGNLKVKRKAHSMYDEMLKTMHAENDVFMSVSTHAFAVAEENAAGGVIVTGPTCGSAGVIPGCVQYLRMKGVSDFHIVRGF